MMLIPLMWFQSSLPEQMKTRRRTGLVRFRSKYRLSMVISWWDCCAMFSEVYRESQREIHIGLPDVKRESSTVYLSKYLSSRMECELMSFSAVWKIYANENETWLRDYAGVTTKACCWNNWRIYRNIKIWFYLNMDHELNSRFMHHEKEDKRLQQSIDWLSCSIYLYSLPTFQNFLCLEKLCSCFIFSVFVLNVDSLFIHSFIDSCCCLSCSLLCAVLCMRRASGKILLPNAAQLMSLYVNLCNFRFSASIFQ